MKALLLSATILATAAGVLQLGDRAVDSAPAAAETAGADDVVGVWTVTTTDPDYPATLMIEEIDGTLTGRWYGPERFGMLADVRLVGDDLSFRFVRADARVEAEVRGGTLVGELSAPAGTTTLRGERLGTVVSVRGS